MDSIEKRTESVIFSDTLSDRAIAEIIVSNGKSSQSKRAIETAKRYFDGKGDIERKKRVYYDKNKKEYDNPAASNAKIRSSFLRMLVQQKQDYALAKTFVIKLATAKETEVDLAKDEYGKAWKNFCDKYLYKISYRLAGQSVNGGIAWAYLWIDENGELQIKDMPAELVYPVWYDRQHQKLDKCVYNYVRTKYTSSSPDCVEYAEYWTDESRLLFNVSNSYTEEDDIGGDHAHMTGGVSWGRIPFIALKATDDEKPLLDFIKPQIDAYDMVFSRGIDGVIDDLDPLLVVKDMSNDLEVIKETKELMRLTRLVAVSPDGDVHYITANTDINKHVTAMEKLRKDIFKFGYGVDIQDARFGGNPNELELKTLYQDMDTYTDGLERHFQDFIDELKYFFDKWWELSGHGAFAIAQSYKVLVKFDRSMLINQSAQIDDTIKLQNTGVSKKTILEFNPVVQDVEMELKRIEEEEEQQAEKNPLFNFPKIEEKDETEKKDTETDETESEEEGDEK